MSHGRERFKYSNHILLLLSILWTIYTLADGGYAFAEQGALSIENVHIDRVVLRPGDKVHISFLLTRDADVSAFVYDPDYAVVKTLMRRQTKKAGTITAVWDGRDDLGKPVPDEAYFISIVAETSDGLKAIYDPTTFSGGEISSVRVDKVEGANDNYNIYYSLERAARISIRAGVHEGPLLKTIMDWEPQPPGNYVFAWDGMDDTGRIRVLDMPGAVIDIRGFLLPQGTIIVRESGGDYLAYHKSLKSRAKSAGIISYKSVRKNVIQRKGENISQQYLVQRALNVAPDFSVYLEGDSSSPLADRVGVNVSGEVGLVIKVGPESMPNFNESRYEIVVFIDNRRFDEEEQAFSPYTYILDTKRLKNGEHLVSVNLAGLAGQVGSYSFKLNVNN